LPTTLPKVNRWYNANGTAVEQRTYPEAASQTFKRGDAVYLASGKVTVAITTGSDVAGATKLLGIALADASGTTDTGIPVALASHNLRWVLPVASDDSSDTTVVTDVGAAYGLRRHGDGKWAINTNEGTDTKVVVTSITPDYAVGETYGLYECAFLDAQVDVRV